MVDEKNVVNVSTKTKNMVVRYIHNCEQEISAENVVGVYVNLKRELVPNSEGVYEDKALMRTTIVTNGPFTSALPEDKEFLGNAKRGEDSILVNFALTSLQDYKDYSMCADVYTGSILRDDYNTLATIKQEFAENLTEVDAKTVSREKVRFSRK